MAVSTLGLPVIRMIWQVGSMSRMARSTSSPLMSGILRSTITASGLSTGSSARAARASVRVMTVNPKSRANRSTMANTSVRRRSPAASLQDSSRSELDPRHLAAQAADLPIERLTDFPAECVRGERLVQERDPGMQDPVVDDRVVGVAGHVDHLERRSRPPAAWSIPVRWRPASPRRSAARRSSRSLEQPKRLIRVRGNQHRVAQPDQHSPRHLAKPDFVFNDQHRLGPAPRTGDRRRAPRPSPRQPPAGSTP